MLTLPMPSSGRKLRNPRIAGRIRNASRRGRISRFTVSVLAAAGALVLLGILLIRLRAPGNSRPSAQDKSSIVLYCAAGIRGPIEPIAQRYQQESGRGLEIQYGGSNTLLSQLAVAQTGDLYLAADEVYIDLARKRGLIAETFALASMYPVIAVAQGNPKEIRSVADLLRSDVRTALGNVEQAAIGRKARALLQPTGQWEPLREHVTNSGVFQPTVPEVANDIKLGSVDAGIVWNTTVAMYPELEAVRDPVLDKGSSQVMLGVLASSTQPTRALHAARYISARDRGLPEFEKRGFPIVSGDEWRDRPQLTFFCGAVNRRAVESVVAQFAEREGIEINTVYNGCGILTAQMRTIRDQRQDSGFPDTYMACDRYYLDSVHDWFQDDVDLSDTEIVIAVAKGNPRNIKGIQDLTTPGIRITVGQPEQCTVGVLTRHLLQALDVQEQVMANVVQETTSSALLIPTVTTGAADATFAYATDCIAESDKVDVIRLGSENAMAIQPFAIARSSAHKHLGRRLLNAFTQSRQSFETAGFHFRSPTMDTRAASPD